MKALRSFLLICILCLLVLSCEKDEPFYQVQPFETAIHTLVSEYRVSQGKSALVWFPDIFVEAREQAIAWKNSGDINTGILERQGKIVDHWAPTNLDLVPGLLIGKADTAGARVVVEDWIADSATNAVLLEDFVQSGAGIAESADLVYIIHILMKIPTK